MTKQRIWLILAVLVLVLAACSDDGEGETETVVVPSTATTDPNAPTATPTFTPLPPTPMPPTWTPVASLTAPPPQPTIEYTYQAPTQPPLILPTYTPSPVQPTATPPGPRIIVTSDMLNQGVQAEMEVAIGTFVEAAPVITFQEGVMFIDVTVYTTLNDPATARDLRIQTRIVPESGRIKMEKITANFTDNNAVYDDDIVDNLINTVENQLDSVVFDLYQANNPGGDAFYISEIAVSVVGITLQTVSLS